VEKPIEIVKIDDRRIRELEGELNFLRDENRKIKIGIEEWRSKYSMLEMQGPKIIEKKIEVPVEIIKVDDRRIRELEGELNFLREENRKIKIGIEEWRSKYSMLEMQGPKIVERKIEVPVEVVKYVDKIIDRPFEVIKEKVIVDDKRIRELEFQINGLIEENRRLKGTLDEWRAKLMEFEESKGHAERAKRSANQDKAFFESEIVRLKKQIEELLSRGPQIVEKIVEKPIEIIKIDDRRIRELEGELNFLRDENRKIKIGIEEWRSKYSMLEMQGPKIIEKKIEIPVEVIKEKVVVDDRRIRELENELNFFREENRKIKISVEEWRSKYSMLEMQGPKIIEKKIEVPVEVIKEKIIVDDSKVVQLTYEIERLRQILDMRDKEIEDWKSRYSKMEIQITEFRGKEGRLMEYENRIAMMASELERLNGFIAKLKNENNELLIKLSDLEGEKTRHERVKQSSMQDKSMFENKIVMLTGEIDRLNIIITELRGKEGRFIELENRLAMMASEIERLNGFNKKLREENDSLNIKIQELRSFEGRIAEYENRVAMMASEMERLNGLIRKLREENDGLNIKIGEFRGFEGKIMEYENRITMMASEMERLNMVIRKLREENDGLNIRIGEFRGYEGRISEYENRITMMASEMERLNALIKKLREENDGLNIKIGEFRGFEGRLTEYENRIAMMASEIERLNGFIRKLREENEGYLIRIREFDDQNQHHERVKQSSAQDKNFLEGKVTMLSQEIDRLNIIIVELRTKEGRLVEYENKLAMLSSETSRLQMMLKMKSEEIESWKSKYIQIEYTMVQFRDADMKIGILNQEIERLNGVVTQQKSELDEWRYKYTEYSSLTTTIQEHLCMFVRLFAEIESLRGRVVQKDQEMEEMRKSGLMQVLNKY